MMVILIMIERGTHEAGGNLYARDSCVSLPRTHKVFRIFNTSVKPRRLLTSAEFGENLKILLGKRAGRITITMQEFSDALHELYQADIGN